MTSEVTKAFSYQLLDYVGLQDASKMRFSQDELRGFFVKGYEAAEQAAAKRERELVELLKTVRDYIDGVARGLATYDECGAGLIEVAQKDIARVDAALAKYGEQDD